MSENTTDLMIDLETFGLDRNCVLISIGAVVFDREKKSAIKDLFFCNVCPKSCLKLGLKNEELTLKWWDDPSRKDAFEYLKKDQKDIAEVMSDLFEFIKRHKPKNIWANSPSFDCEKLKFTASLCGLEVPWKFYQEKCVRTAVEIVRFDPDEDSVKTTCSRLKVEPIPHTPIYDCVSQIVKVQAVFLFVKYMKEDSDFDLILEIRKRNESKEDKPNKNE